MKKRLLVLPLLVGIAVFIAGFKLNAQQQPKGLRATPVSFELNLEKGSATTETIHLDNFTDTTVEISAHAENFSAQGEQGGVSLSNEDTPYSLAKWITIYPTYVTMTPNQRQDFQVTIKPPHNAEAGGHFGSVIFSTVPPKNLKTSGATITQSVAALILTKIPGIVNESAYVESFKTNQSFYEFGPVDFNLRVKNNSSIHIKPIGVITIKNELTGKKTFVGINGENILPGAVRQLKNTWPQNFLFGKYIATANLSYGSENLPLQASIEFVGFPIRYGLILIGLLIVIFLLRKRLWKAVRIIIKGK